MKKIRVVTFHYAHNYGAMLQAYALQKKIERCQKEIEIKFIDYRKKSIVNLYKVFIPLRKNIIKWVVENYNTLKYYDLKKLRYNVFNDFLNCKLHLTNAVRNINEIENADVYITGSDQVWNPDIVGEVSDIYTLNFGDDKIKRISYAASIGSSKIEEKYKADYKNKLERLDYISVREEDAKKALEEIIDKPIEVVLDPTLLLTENEWNEKIQDCKREKENYILAYVVEEDEEYTKIVNYLSEKTGLKVIHFEKRDKYKNVLRSAYTDGPLEFVNLLKNAEYVIATSFHATVFSIIFHKKFFIVPHKKTGSRVTNLLKKLGINNRVVHTLNDFEKIDYNFETDWNLVEEKLEQERRKSIDWLNKAIEG